MQEAIASPGGSTEAGLDELAERDVHAAFKAAVDASLERMRGPAMSTVLAAIDRNDVAQFVDSLFLVFIILVIASVAISWYVNFRGSLPYNTPLRAVTGFIEETTVPYLNALRRFMPPIGARWHVARPEPDDRPDAPVRGASDRRRADQRVTRPARIRPCGCGARWSRVALDQLTKAIVRGRPVAGRAVDLLPGVDLVRVANRGIAFGLLDDAGSLVLVLAAVAFASLLAMFLAASDRRGLWLADRAARRRRDRQPDRPDPRRGPSPISSTSDRGRRSTSPTSRSPSGSSILVLIYAFGEPRARSGRATGPARPEPGSG